MDPITLNGKKYIKTDGTWYLLQEGNDLIVIGKELIKGLDAIYSIDLQLQPFIEAHNKAFKTNS